MEATKAMLNWGFLKKPAALGTDEAASSLSAAEDWAFLRTQTDHDGGQTAASHSGGVAVAGVSAPGASSEADSGWGSELEIPADWLVCPEVFQDNYASGQRAEAGAPRAAAPAASFIVRPLTLQVLVGNRSMLLTIEGEAVIGRRDLERGTRPEIDISNDDAVSRRHAWIFVRGGCYLVRDLGSTNGTRHNGRLLREDEDVPLTSGDEISVGDRTVVRVLDLALEADLTSEDRALENMLQEALGVSAPSEPVEEFVLEAWALVQDRKPAADLLEVALEQGSEAGLIVGPVTAPPPLQRPERTSDTRPRHLA